MNFFFALLLFVSFSAVAQSPMEGAKLAPPLPANLWIEMARISKPGVVGIYLDIDIRKSRVRRDPLFDFLEEFFGGGFQYEDPKENSENSSPIGTGFIIDQKGHIVTNYHVVEMADNQRLPTKLQVHVNGESHLLDAKILGRDPRGDLALLKLVKPPKNLHALQFGDSDKLQVGEYVAAFGNPYGHSDTMTVGIVSAKGRAIKEINRFPFIQTDASINPGNSGGPLLNTQGYVIGVNSAIDPRAQGIGFAIPSNYAKKIINTLKNGGTIQRGFLGIGMALLHPQVARSYGIKKGGIVVTQVQSGYPAANAGIQAMDIIYKFDGKPVSDTESFVRMVQDSEVGKVVSVEVLRPTDNSFKDMKFKVTIGDYPQKNARPTLKKSRPTPPPHADHKEFKGKEVPYGLGFAIVESSSGNRREYNVPIRFPFGPIISGVKDASPADRGGMDVGDVLLRVNGQGVNNIADVMKALRPGVNRFWIHTERGERKVSLKSEMGQ